MPERESKIQEHTNSSFVQRAKDIGERMPGHLAVSFLLHEVAMGATVGYVVGNFKGAVVGTIAGAGTAIAEGVSVPYLATGIERTWEKVRSAGRSIAEFAKGSLPRKERGEDNWTWYGWYGKKNMQQYYPSHQYDRMIRESFPAENTTGRNERLKLWECQERFWELMSQARDGDGNEKPLEVQELKPLLLQMMRQVIFEKNPQELIPFEGSPEIEGSVENSVVHHLYQTERSIHSLASALERSGAGDSFLSSHNRKLLEFVASIHDLFNGFSRREGQVMLDHQFILEDFIFEFLRAGQKITLGGEQVTLSLDDENFLRNIARHENIFEEKDWDHFVMDGQDNAGGEINRAKGMIFLADVLGDGVAFNEETDSIEIDSTELAKRLQTLMRRHMSHTDEMGIPLTDSDGKEIDGKIFRPEWLLSVKTMINVFRSLHRSGVTIQDKDGYADPLHQLVYAALNAIGDALSGHVVGTDGLEVCYTPEQAERIETVRDQLKKVLNENTPLVRV